MSTKTLGSRTPLEDQLTRLLETTVSSARDRQLVQRVLGWDDKGGCSLKEAGDEVGISRERSRQVYQNAIEQMQICELNSSLDEVLAYVNFMCNRDADDVQTELQIRGFTRFRFEMRALLKTAQIFGRVPKFTLEEIGGKSFVVAGPGVVHSILKAALRSSSRYGVQTVSEMCTAIAPKCRRACDRILVRQVLKTRHDLRWLDAREEKFWLAAAPRNPMILCLKKLLFHASPVNVSDLHRAISRLPGTRRAPISRRQLISFCHQVPFCCVRKSSVESVGRFGAANLIGKPERIVCRILQQHGNELSVQRLRSLAASAGVTRSNFWRIVQYSPLIYRRAPRIYRVITAASSAEEGVNLRTA